MSSFYIYLPIQEVRSQLGMTKNKEVKNYNFDDFQVSLKKRHENTLIEIKSIDGSDTFDALVAIKRIFGKYTVDVKSIQRIDAILSLNVGNKWWNEIRKDLVSGEPLNWKVEEILDEVEDRISNPDPEIMSLFERAFARSGTNNNFLNSLNRQFRGGRELSNKQLDALKKMSGTNLSPLEGMLEDLKRNGRLSRDQFKLVVKAIHKKDTLTDDEKKMIRHLIYRNVNRLTGKYTKDFVRENFKNANMKRASRMKTSASGMYGFTKAVQRNVEVAVRKMQKRVDALARGCERKYPEAGTYFSNRCNTVKCSASKILSKHCLLNKQPKRLGKGPLGFNPSCAKSAHKAISDVIIYAGEVSNGLYHKDRNHIPFLKEHIRRKRCPYARILLENHPPVL